MDIQTYLSNEQNIIQVYQNLISLGFADGNRQRVESLIIERDSKLDELRRQFFGNPQVSNLKHIESHKEFLRESLLIVKLPIEIRDEIIDVLRDAMNDQGWSEVSVYIERIEGILIKNRRKLLTFVQDSSIL